MQHWKMLWKVILNKLFQNWHSKQYYHSLQNNLKTALYYTFNNYFLVQIYLEIKSLDGTEITLRLSHPAVLRIPQKTVAMTDHHFQLQIQQTFPMAPYHTWNPGTTKLFPGVKQSPYFLCYISKKIEEQKNRTIPVTWIWIPILRFSGSMTFTVS